MAERIIGSGESTTMTVFVYDAEGDEISFLWEEDPICIPWIMLLFQSNSGRLDST